ncbi:hypothetical protein POX_e06901 [Penicillium oxalicum]|uniref:hypothetical protein n=1 Tax=Penicillium oxalicum TaxID=69781 RepID=UPI0020B6DAB5|nr:hypothetical protein POX_e06901 [Penicillium oxalicum]KAI2788877.1 hypothetical protein POX_e06901 [Penicillium oxalicum]
MKFAELPSEIICQVVLHLPTANAITRLAQTCRRIHKILKAEEAWLFRAFVRSKFPGIQTPPFWKDAVCALTSRSRALDRLGIIGRFVTVPDSETVTRIGVPDAVRQDNPTLGYRPPIDSYEIWNGESWAAKKEVLAWGAGEKLLLRTRHTGKHCSDDWVLFNGVDEPSSHDDILGLHLLDAEHGKDGDVENVIFGRRRGDLRQVALSSSAADYEYKKTFQTEGLELSDTDLMRGPDPILCAQFLQGATALYQVASEKEIVQPFAWIQPERSSRGRRAKLLSSTRIAVATMNERDSLIISRIRPDGVYTEETIEAGLLGVNSNQIQRNHHAPQAISVIEPLHDHPLADHSGNVFLAAWGDRAVRLHDLRSPRLYETAYEDPTDDNSVYSLKAFGHDRFIVGSGGNALIKLFDLRCTSYSYLHAHASRPKAPSTAPIAHNHGQYPSRNFNIFLSAPSPAAFTAHAAQSRRRTQVHPYRGPIYSLSAPSPSSPTLYTGVAGGLIRLDFASTDDLTGPAKEWYHQNLDLGFDGEMNPVDGSSFFTMAGYERPSPDDLTTTSKLRKQHGNWRVQEDVIHRRVVSGWDQRWEALERPGAWRRQDG